METKSYFTVDLAHQKYSQSISSLMQPTWRGSLLKQKENVHHPGKGQL
jgi:hypothetical protein